MNRKLTTKPDTNNDSEAQTQTWAIEDRTDMYLSDFDPIHNVNLRGKDVFCLYNVNSQTPQSVLVSITLITNINEFIGVLQAFDKKTNYEHNDIQKRKRSLAKHKKPSKRRR